MIKINFQSQKIRVKKTIAHHYDEIDKERNR